MNFVSLDIEGLILIEPSVFQDNRGSFRRNLCLREMELAGIDFNVKQGNISENSNRHTLRGFHYQKSPSNESKLLTPITGSIFNVVVDLRKNSKTFLKAFSLILSADKKASLLVPAGCANCFLTLAENTIVHYYMNDFFREDSYAGFRYDDPFFGIEFPCQPNIISQRDLMFPKFSLDLI
jgi:dTDP-4-dehydrorhamnose 3,5-epimerase